MPYIKTNKLLSCLLEILQLMLESGAEVYRIEESAMRICNAYGIRRTDVYATTSNIIVSVELEEGNIKTHTRRIGLISTDIEKLDHLNALVRYITNRTPDTAEIWEHIKAIKNTPNYPTWVSLVLYGIIAGNFYLFFGGRNIAELLSSLGIGLLVGILTQIFSQLQANRLLSRFLYSFTACISAFALCRLHLIGSVDYVIIGNIMTLIPGIGLTNALRDLFTGDIISGILRMIESALMAIAIACGFIVASVLLGGGVA